MVLAHFFRQVIVRPHATQGLLGKDCLFPLKTSPGALMAEYAKPRQVAPHMHGNVVLRARTANWNNHGGNRATRRRASELVVARSGLVVESRLSQDGRADVWLRTDCSAGRIGADNATRVARSGGISGHVKHAGKWPGNVGNNSKVGRLPNV